MSAAALFLCFSLQHLFDLTGTDTEGAAPIGLRGGIEVLHDARCKKQENRG